MASSANAMQQKDISIINRQFYQIVSRSQLSSRFQIIEAVEISRAAVGNVIVKF